MEAIRQLRRDWRYQILCSVLTIAICAGGIVDAVLKKAWFAIAGLALAMLVFLGLLRLQIQDRRKRRL